MLWFAIATCSALLSAAAAVAQKKALFRLSALELAFSTSAMLAACSLVLPVWIDVTGVSPGTLGIILVKSLLGSAAFLLVMTALERNQLSGALPLLGLTPAVTALCALVLLGESLHGREWAGIAAMAAGVYLLEGTGGNGGLLRPLKGAPGSRRQHLPVAGALLLFAASSILDRLLVGIQRIEPLVVLFYQHIIYAVLFGALLAARRTSLRHLTGALREQLPLLGAIALLTIVYRLAQLEATAIAPVALVLAVKRTSILYASFFGGKLFGEERLRVRLAAGAIIVAGGFLILRNVS